MMNPEKLHVAFTKGMQPATNAGETATINATGMQPKSLKALALSNLQCNSQCNSPATETKKHCNFPETKEPDKLQPTPHKVTADEMLKNGISEINKDYPTGALEWTRLNRPDSFRAMNEAENHLNSTYKDRDSKGYRQALSQFVEAHEKMVKVYKMRVTCQDKGYCLQLTQEQDCNLYPQEIGSCRERI